ncbi:MAG: PEP-CTERM sorting domain-containing protein [Bryobacteraceae bacterium]|jgi:MYXO-CTERM domain-containing protein
MDTNSKKDVQEPILTSPASKAHFGNWGIYAAAAGATLAMSTNADASIIYGTLGQNVSIGTGAGNTTAAKTFVVSAVQKDIESIYLRRFSAVGGAASSANAKIIGGLAFATTGGATSGGGHAAKNFALNAPIGASRHFSGHGGTFLEKHTSSNALKGFFGGDQTGFVGFSNGFGNYGWIRVSVSDAGSPGYTNELTVIDYAYNTIATDPIDAGEGIPTGTPEPGTAALGLLASGAVGLAVWRRRRKEVDAG